jgi:acetyl-CoA C-acetyltransferase
MIDVVIAGIGQTAAGEHWDISLRELGYAAMEASRRDAGGLAPQALFVGNMLSPQLSRQAHLGTLMTDFAGLTGIESVVVEAAGASGGAALRMGYLAVASGQVDAALVLGVEKFTDTIGPEGESALATAGDGDYEAPQGLTLSAQAALLMRRYMHEYGMPADGLACFPVNAHANGAGNRFAMFQKAISAETYSKAGKVSDPLNTFDMAPYVDGAAAVVLTRADLLPPIYDRPLVRISGSSVTTDTLALHDRPDPLLLQAVRLGVEQACRRAGILPGEADLFELNDSFSIYAALSLEAAGLAERGQGWQMASQEEIGLKGRMPVSTMGGLKARGNAGGATGVYQAVEAVLQLRGEAGPNTIPGAAFALIQCFGGPASSVATHVLEKMTS